MYVGLGYVHTSTGTLSVQKSGVLVPPDLELQVDVNHQTE